MAFKKIKALSTWFYQDTIIKWNYYKKKKKKPTIEIYTKINYKTFGHAINTFISLKQSKINIDNWTAEKYCLVLMYCLFWKWNTDWTLLMFSWTSCFMPVAIRSSTEKKNLISIVHYMYVFCHVLFFPHLSAATTVCVAVCVTAEPQPVGYNQLRTSQWSSSNHNPS